MSGRWRGRFPVIGLGRGMAAVGCWTGESGRAVGQGLRRFLWPNLDQLVPYRGVAHSGRK